MHIGEEPIESLKDLELDKLHQKTCEEWIKKRDEQREKLKEKKVVFNRFSANYAKMKN
jgi:hypothetical protein